MKQNSLDLWVLLARRGSASASAVDDAVKAVTAGAPHHSGRISRAEAAEIAELCSFNRTPEMTAPIILASVPLDRLGRSDRCH